MQHHKRLYSFYIEQIIHQYGVSEQIVTYEVPDFSSYQWANVMQQFSIFYSMDATEHQQFNGLVEKSNGAIEDRLVAFIADHPTKWNRQLSASFP